ncbi:hypothetical protein ACH4UM_21290 [Streptomyces sp. NPDC020801]|uniref:hypothetical protein n=1 Tax=unclassified Streptomyces TaxID=2593676 RepID=UPI0037ADE394
MVLAGSVLLGAAQPASAHGDTIAFRVAPGPSGQVLAVGSYGNDKDPVDGTVIALMTAKASDGRSVGPWRLVPVPDTAGGFTTREHLPKGWWQVTVRSAFPELGYGQGKVTVSQPVTSRSPAGTPAPAGGAAWPHQSEDRNTAGRWITVAAVAMVVCALAAGPRCCRHHC